MTKAVEQCFHKLMHLATESVLNADAYREICEEMLVSKMYYDMNLGDTDRYRNHRTGKLIMAELEQEDKIILFDNGEKTDLKLTYTYYYDGIEYVHAYIEFKEGVQKEELDLELYQFAADVIYLLASRQNMRMMLDFAEVTDALTGIPNIVFVNRKYAEVTKSSSPQDFLILYINLQNFKYVNESAGAKTGDEAIIQYARRILSFIKEDEAVCRMGGDNFVMLIHKENFQTITEKLSCVTISRLENAPNQTFEISAWIGISELQPGEEKPLIARINDASVACNLGKSRLKKNIVLFDMEMVKMMSQGRNIIAMFRPAVRNQEFCPFFQAKVDMQTGALVGFEALCRWIHEGRFIYPDQFIPILDKEGLIHDLDMAIFRETCRSIRKWKDMGLHPPRISSNFSRKNLFVPDIEEKIFQTIQDNGLEASDIEIEITESVQESEYDRLIAYVKKLKEFGLHIAIDDFGTGYSSLSLIHNIDADVVKIDKSFIDEIQHDCKSKVLIESIISIAKRLDMVVIAEGVETAEQGKMLLEMGCPYAQGYYYSKPVNFEAATSLISNPAFQPIGGK